MNNRKQVKMMWAVAAFCRNMFSFFFFKAVLYIVNFMCVFLWLCLIKCFAVCLSCISAALFMFARNSDHQLTLWNCLTKKLSLPTDSDDIVLNFAATNHGGQSETIKEVMGKLSKSRHK